MSHGDVLTRSTQLFFKRKETNRSKTLFSWNNSSTNYVHMEKSKKITKDTITSNNRFLLNLKSDQLFAAKAKFKISKKTKGNNFFKF